jgi:hypothetical protein
MRAPVVRALETQRLVPSLMAQVSPNATLPRRRRNVMVLNDLATIRRGRNLKLSAGEFFAEDGWVPNYL